MAGPLWSSPMIGPYRIEGYAIVSADGMIADRNGAMPDTIRNDADQRFLQAELDRAAVIVHGRHSHEGGPRAARRKRLVVTRQIASIAPDPSLPNALLWNPAAATLEEALAKLGVGSGIDRDHRRDRRVRYVFAALRRFPPYAGRLCPNSGWKAGVSVGRSGAKLRNMRSPVMASRPAPAMTLTRQPASH